MPEINHEMYYILCLRMECCDKILDVSIARLSVKPSYYIVIQHYRLRSDNHLL